MRSTYTTRRAGYTLMEMMLVMTIIVLAAAIGVPVIQSMLADGRHIAAGDQVRSQLAEARSRAMDEGRPWRLAYIPGTGMYQLAPEDSPLWDQMEREPVDSADVVRDSLPQDICFAATQQEILGGAEGGAPGGNWETIAVYLPAGNARDDLISYFGPMGFMPMRVEVRALTGAVDIQQALPDGGMP